MARGNRSYYPIVSTVLPGVRTGRQALKCIKKISSLSDAAESALRKYSQSAFPMQEDGKILNASLLSNESDHAEWASGMDEACTCWEVQNDILIWRGWKFVPPADYPAFLSCTLVERQARRFHLGHLTAMVLPKGTLVALPMDVWRWDDPKRTLGVVKREVEIILPRNQKLEIVEHVNVPWAKSIISLVDVKSPVLLTESV